MSTAICLYEGAAENQRDVSALALQLSVKRQRVRASIVMMTRLRWPVDAALGAQPPGAQPPGAQPIVKCLDCDSPAARIRGRQHVRCKQCHRLFVCILTKF